MKPGSEESLIRLKFLGQAGFLIQRGQSQLLIDPYLSNYVVDGGLGPAEIFSRAFPAPVNLDELADVDLIFLTHDHGDHFDPDTILPLYRLNPNIQFVCPKPVAAHMLKLGISERNITVPEVGTLQHFGELEFYAVPAAHYSFDRDPLDGAYSYFGFVIRLGESWLYHAGDTLLYAEMIQSILKFAPGIDIACLPVNGRDGVRERMDMIGNLDAAEVFYLAQALKVDVLLPMHNDLFAANHVNPAILMDILDRKAPRQKVHWLQPGEDFYY